MLIKLKNSFLQLPDFIHNFGDPTPHHPRNSLALHLGVERALYHAKRVLDCDVGDAVPGYSIWNGALTVLFGLNCSFPLRDVAMYSAWISGLLRLRKV